MPFMNDAPDVVANVLSNLLDNAHAAIPDVLKIGRKLGKVDRSKIETIFSNIDHLLLEYVRRITPFNSVCSQHILCTTGNKKLCLCSYQPSQNVHYSRQWQIWGWRGGGGAVRC